MTSGASPAGVEAGNEAEAARHIRRMFGRVAPRYDLLNRLLSLRIDQYWRRAVVRRVGPYLERPEARVKSEPAVRPVRFHWRTQKTPWRRQCYHPTR